jgi:RNA-directed DNA polymerase
VLASIAQFLTAKLRLKVNSEKSAVARPWDRKFLGYSMTFHKQPRLKVSPAVVDRMKAKLRKEFRAGRGRNIRTLIKELIPFAGLGKLLPTDRGQAHFRRIGPGYAGNSGASSGDSGKGPTLRQET